MTIAPGRIIMLIAAGTTGTGVRGFAQRWIDDPFVTYWTAAETARQWCIANKIAFEHCLYHPGGAQPTGSRGVMELNQYPLLHETNPTMAEVIAAVFRTLAMTDKPGDFHGVYLGSPAAFEWRTKQEIADPFLPFVVAGRSSVVLDQLAGTREQPFISTPKNAELMRQLGFTFASVIGEGGIGPTSWLTVPVLHAADTHEEIYQHRPDMYRSPQWVIVKNVPASLKDASPDDKTAWKLDQCRLWLPRGVNVMIEVNHLEGVTYNELAYPSGQTV